MALLEVRKLEKRFQGVHAVDHVDLSFEAGSITALVGPNGSGKTTIINTITGLLPMDGGELRVGDATFTAIRPADAALHGITRTFQNVRLIGQMSVLDNLLLVVTTRSIWSSLLERHDSTHLDRVNAALAEVGLREKRHERAENLSFGQRKLLEVARATLTDARVYFFDEPFAGLFPGMRKTVSSILRRLRDSGAAVALVEHDMNLIRDLCDYCYVLDSGTVLASGKPADVLRDERVVDAYLGK